MKKIIIILFVLFACNKQNVEQYRIINLGASGLNVITDESTYFVKQSEFIDLATKGNLSYSFENPNLKVKTVDLHTSPLKTLNVDSYEYDFRVTVTGQADSVQISINGQYFNTALPFEFGGSLPDSYNIISTTDGKAWTIVYINGFASDYCEQEAGEICRLNGN